MKKRTKIAVMCVAAAAVAATGMAVSDQTSENSLNELLLENVEAIASEEFDDNPQCFGVGEIKCPHTGEGVSYVAYGYSLR